MTFGIISKEIQERRKGSIRCAIESDIVRCRNCEVQFGRLRNGNLILQEIIITNRTIFRCSKCKEKNEFIPAR